MRQGIPRDYLYALRYGSNVEAGILVLICIFFLATGRNNAESQSCFSKKTQQSSSETYVVDPIVFTLNINEATVPELSQLPRIGAKLAERIVEYRKNNGEYENLDALTNVKGIGPKTIDRLRPYCVVQLTSTEQEADVGQDSVLRNSAPISGTAEHIKSEE